MRIQFVELPHLAVSSPAGIASAGVLQIQTCYLLESTRRIEARGELVGERLVVDEAIVASKANGVFIQTLGIELAAFEAGDLGADQRSAVFEIFRAVRCPHLELRVMDGQHLPTLGAFRDEPRIAAGSLRQRRVEMVFRLLKDGWRGPEKPFGVRRSGNGGSVGASEEARLQFADPVPAGGERKARILGQVPLEPSLVESGVIERPKDRGQAAQRPDQP